MKSLVFKELCRKKKIFRINTYLTVVYIYCLLSEEDTKCICDSLKNFNFWARKSRQWKKQMSKSLIWKIAIQKILWTLMTTKMIQNIFSRTCKVKNLIYLKFHVLPLCISGFSIWIKMVCVYENIDKIFKLYTAVTNYSAERFFFFNLKCIGYYLGSRKNWWLSYSEYRSWNS